MFTTIQRWGNSLAVRIPKAFAAQAELDENAHVEIAIQDKTIVIRPARAEYSLKELVRSITVRNRHREFEWGEPVGNEAW